MFRRVVDVAAAGDRLEIGGRCSSAIGSATRTSWSSSYPDCRPRVQSIVS
jgi:hypothetical protein